MKFIKNIKDILFPKYKITLDICSEPKYNDKPLRLPQLGLMIIDQVEDIKNNKLNLSYGVMVGDIIQAGIESGHIKQYHEHYYICNNLIDVINNYKLIKV